MADAYQGIRHDVRLAACERRRVPAAAVPIAGVPASLLLAVPASKRSTTTVPLKVAE
jgi:hypothetical protein